MKENICKLGFHTRNSYLYMCTEAIYVTYAYIIHVKVHDFQIMFGQIFYPTSYDSCYNIICDM